MRGVLKAIFILSLTAFSAGCKLAVIVVEGGEVQSTSSGTCVANAICIVDVTDPNFSETFTAIPGDGWYFMKWNSGDGFFCRGSTDPECTLSFEGHEETEAVQEIVKSSETFYMMPVFKPRKDILKIGSKEWLQTDLFTNLSWNDIAVVCSSRTGACDGILKGYEMAGWTWASVEEIKALFNYYIGSEEHLPDVYESESIESTWAEAFYNDGWIATDYVTDDPGGEGRITEGWLRGLAPEDERLGLRAMLWDRIRPKAQLPPQDEASGDLALSGGVERVNVRRDLGGWFYRTL
jgi:hypothetical protein